MTNAKKAYREDAVRGATPIGLVVLLYEQAIQDLQRALAAIKQNDVEKRTRELNHAMRVLGQLQGSLNKNEGGVIAANLERFYQTAVASLLTAQIQVSPEIIRRRIGDLLELREAWLETERRLAQPQSAVLGQSTGDPRSESDRESREWRG
jgi:flagellar secretion chaperone FliS